MKEQENLFCIQVMGSSSITKFNNHNYVWELYLQSTSTPRNLWIFKSKLTATSYDAMLLIEIIHKDFRPA